MTINSHAILAHFNNSESIFLYRYSLAAVRFPSHLPVFRFQILHGRIFAYSLDFSGVRFRNSILSLKSLISSSER
ncbi:hypothetical protein L1987_06248 [Smallanthus sonchifolius]|uniref:Uncharacterized protein n=1 Tax=Smallanthus sonchifolius TaxID=185202 RepID=A0ACB9JXR0_9ASTR|nr:hypothetical protein L1987_06248 [Smallanthus sonchifolius]